MSQAPMSQGLAQQAQAALTQGMALAAQQQGTGVGMGTLGQQQSGLQGMSQGYGQQHAMAGSLQQQGQQAGLQAALASFQQQQLQQQQAQGAQQQHPTPGQQRGVDAQQQQALAEEAGRAHQAMVEALSSQQLGAGSLQNLQQQQQQELWQEEHQQQGLLQLQQGMRDAEAGEASSESAPHLFWCCGCGQGQLPAIAGRMRPCCGSGLPQGQCCLAVPALDSVVP